MCGIAGIINLTESHPPPPVDLLKKMIDTLSHRGPDEFGYYRDLNAGIAHARLSIIDLTTGQQPLCNENETLWITFNGEIYNYIELRSELEIFGHRFKTKSDTEVIIHAYENWGTECFKKFNGQWAVAIWDSKHKKLVLSRDHVGILPLYIKEENNRVWFASEVKAIFADPSVSREINAIALDQIFTYWAPIAPETIFSGIEELKPGTIRIYEYDKNKIEKRFWQPTFPQKDIFTQRSYENIVEASQQLEVKLLNATKLRMLRADVPVGSYLSGGLDSSLVAWMGRKVKQGEFRTFSIRFEDAEFDETKFQHMLAATLESKHEEIVVTKKDIADYFPEIIIHTERPILRTAPVPLFILSKLVNDYGFKAVITGEGADEFLAGYDLFREDKVRRFLANQPTSKIRPLLFERLYPYLALSPSYAKGISVEFWKRGFDNLNKFDFSHVPRWTTTASLKKFFSEELQSQLQTLPKPDILDTLPEEFSGWDSLSRAQFLEIITLFSGYIISSQGDRMLMSHSVEGRFPFLDIDVIEFCNKLPPDYKLIGLNEKYILKRVAKGKIPDGIIERKKQPYRAPDAISFLTNSHNQYVDEMFSENLLKSFGLFDVKTTRGLFDKVNEKIRNGNYTSVSNSVNMGFIGILSTQLLVHSYIKENHSIRNNNLKFSTIIDRVQGI